MKSAAAVTPAGTSGWTGERGSIPNGAKNAASDSGLIPVVRAVWISETPYGRNSSSPPK
ncbi:hypothetical protein [Kribbella solani]|uniref:Uncharacterized protein n=1 Tax=Kribbella solani TaxID=236067 RepID=A0A841DTR7_9ACTN|nr:hypothetical protein [Kribbella solani]MBB5978728.1 hypothetical protein [Kribbella solani]